MEFTLTIEMNEIIEDLVSETISNPLIEGDRKKQIISNLKSLYFQGAFDAFIDDIRANSIDRLIEEKNADKKRNIENDINNKLTEVIKNIESDSKEYNEQLVAKVNNRSQLSTSALFAIVMIALGAVTSVISLILGILNEGIINEFFNRISNSNTYPDMTLFAISVLVTLITSLITSLITRVLKHKRK